MEIMGLMVILGVQSQPLSDTQQLSGITSKAKTGAKKNNHG